MFTPFELESVLPLVGATVPPTPQYAWPLLKSRTGVEIVVKHENSCLKSRTSEHSSPRKQQDGAVGSARITFRYNNGRITEADPTFGQFPKIGKSFAGTRPAISQVTCGLAQRKAYRRNCVMAGTYAVVSSNRTTCQHGPS